MAQSRVWLDPRLIVGTVLVVGSLLGVTALVNAAGATTGVWSASQTLVPCAVVQADDVEIVQVRLGEVDEAYLDETVDPVGAVVTTTVRSNEMLARSAIGDASSADFAAVVVPIDAGISSEVVAGAVVALWAAEPEEDGTMRASTVLVDGAIVVDVVEDSGLVAAQGREIEMLVDRSSTGEVLDAIARGATLSIVPTAVAIGSTP